MDNISRIPITVGYLALTLISFVYYVPEIITKHNNLRNNTILLLALIIGNILWDVVMRIYDSKPLKPKQIIDNSTFVAFMGLVSFILFNNIINDNSLMINMSNGVIIGSNVTLISIVSSFFIYKNL
jgi:hypothetical protein